MITFSLYTTILNNFEGALEVQVRLGGCQAEHCSFDAWKNLTRSPEIMDISLEICNVYAEEEDKRDRADIQI